MANTKGLLKALDNRLPEVPSQAEEIIKALLTEEEYNEITEGFYVFKAGEVREVVGNPSRGEYRFLALGNKIGGEPKFRKGFWFFTPEGEELTENTPVLALRKAGHLFFNVKDDEKDILTAAEQFLIQEMKF